MKLPYLVREYASPRVSPSELATLWMLRTARNQSIVFLRAMDRLELASSARAAAVTSTMLANLTQEATLANDVLAANRQSLWVRDPTVILQEKVYVGGAAVLALRHYFVSEDDYRLQLAAAGP